MEFLKTVVSILLVSLVAFSVILFGASLYGALTGPGVSPAVLHAVLLGLTYFAAMMYCVWRMTANYRGEDPKPDSEKDNGAFWVLVALCGTYVFAFLGAMIYLSEKISNLPAVIIPLAAFALLTHFLWNGLRSKFVVTIGKEKAASVEFLETRLSLISKNDPRLIYRLARKFMQHTRKEGKCVVLPGLFTIGEEVSAQISTQNEPLPFVSQEMTPDKFKNFISWNLMLGIDEDDPSASTKYGNFETVKQQIISVINSAVTPWISMEEAVKEGEKTQTPQTWWELRQRKEEMRRIAIKALLKTFGPDFASDDALNAATELAALGKMVKLPLLGRVLKLVTCDVRTDEAVEKKATAIGLEDLERRAELADTETQAQKAQKILDRMKAMSPEERERFIEAFGLVTDAELIKDGHGYAVRGDGMLGIGAMIANAISGRGPQQQPLPQPPSDPGSPQASPPRNSGGKRRGKR